MSYYLHYLIDVNLDCPGTYFMVTSELLSYSIESHNWSLSSKDLGQRIVCGGAFYTNFYERIFKGVKLLHDKKADIF